MTIPRIAASTTVLAAAVTLALAAPASAASQANAQFVGGSGNYLTSSGTDNLRQVSGTVSFTQTATGQPFTATGSLTGLQPNTWYVTVPYKDGACIPAAGVTAFPSTAFSTDANGAGSFTTTVNPRAINPTAVFDVPDIRSVSVRQVVVQGTTIPGVAQLPTVPNVGAVEACDRTIQ